MINGYKVPYPDDSLLALIKRVVKYTEKAAIKERKLRPNHFIVQLESHLLDTSIFVHLRSTNDSALHEILSEFERIDQSNRAKGRASIIEGPFIIDCSAIEAKKLKPLGKKRNHPGAGCRRQKLLQKRLKIKYNVHSGAFWENFPVISQTLCLFHSILISCSHVLMDKHNFYNFKRRPTTQKNALEKMLKWCKISKKQRQYSIEEYGDKIQVYLLDKKIQKYIFNI